MPSRKPCDKAAQTHQVIYSLPAPYPKTGTGTSKTRSQSPFSDSFLAIKPCPILRLIQCRHTAWASLIAWASTRCVLLGWAVGNRHVNRQPPCGNFSTWKPIAPSSSKRRRAVFQSVDWRFWVWRCRYPIVQALAYQYRRPTFLVKFCRGPRQAAGIGRHPCSGLLLPAVTAGRHSCSGAQLPAVAAGPLPCFWGQTVAGPFGWAAATWAGRHNPDKGSWGHVRGYWFIGWHHRRTADHRGTPRRPSASSTARRRGGDPDKGR